jgi:WD40 repeat protein
VHRSEGKVVVWNTETLEVEMELLGHEGSVMSCSVNEDGSRIVSCGTSDVGCCAAPAARASTALVQAVE